MNKRSKEQITVISNIVIAVIGLIGTIATAYFAFLQVKIQTDQKQAVQSNVSSTATPTINQSNANANPLPIASPIASSNILRVDLGYQNSCFLSQVFPTGIDPAKDPFGAKTEFDLALEDDTMKKWGKSPALSNGQLMLQITNISTKTEWVRLSNSIVSSITTTTSIPDNVNITHECAGDGLNRNFPPVALDSTYSEYEVSVMDSDVDYFTLQQGEFETFVMTFICKTPGMYRIQISLDYSIGSQTDIVSYQLPNFFCPRTLTNWGSLGSVDKSQLAKYGTYEWNGTKYIEK